MMGVLKYFVAQSPLTNNIYAGRLNAKGNKWLKDKTDVTIDALVAVAEHIKEFGKSVEIKNADGNIIYTLKIELPNSGKPEVKE